MTSVSGGKLTKAQLETLKLINRAPYIEIRDGNIRRVARRLIAAGLCRVTGGRATVGHTYELTDAGRAALSKEPINER